MRLTFDDGPDATVSPQVLDILKAWNVKATFFLIGQSITGNEALVARQVAEGHRIGNHTWDHPHMTQLSAEKQRLQFQSTTDAIIAAGAARPTEWRPPFDDHNTSLRNLATSMGMSMTLWTYPTDSNDWKGLSSTVIRDRVVSGAVKDSIILQHDRIQNTVTALPLIIDGLYNKGLCIHP